MNSIEVKLPSNVGQASLPVLPRGAASPSSTLLQIWDVPAREGKQFRVRAESPLKCYGKGIWRARIR